MHVSENIQGAFQGRTLVDAQFVLSSGAKLNNNKRCVNLQKSAFLGYGVNKQDLVGQGEGQGERAGWTELHRNSPPCVLFTLLDSSRVFICPQQRMHASTIVPCNASKQCGGSNRIRIIWPDPDPHRDGENESGTDLSSIKDTQNKGDKKSNFVLDLQCIMD